MSRKIKIIKNTLFLLTVIFSLTSFAQDFDWAISMGSTNNDVGNSITIDNAGNSYTTGYFIGTADFDPSASTANLRVAGESDIFFAKYDNNGNYLWANRIGGSEDDRGKDIHHDGNGNIFITGGVTGTVDFDPSSGVLAFIGRTRNDTENN